jgi:conjugal transfer pilus assembly protein TraA
MKTMQISRERWGWLALAVLTLVCVLHPDAAYAGSDTTFDNTWNTMQGWLQGSLGRVLSATFITIGLVYGAARQSVMGFATGAGAGIGMNTAPGVIGQIVGASLPTVAAARDVTLHFINIVN